jgi:hypothetical protein
MKKTIALHKPCYASPGIPRSTTKATHRHIAPQSVIVDEAKTGSSKLHESTSTKFFHPATQPRKVGEAERFLRTFVSKCRQDTDKQWESRGTTLRQQQPPHQQVKPSSGHEQVTAALRRCMVVAKRLDKTVGKHSHRSGHSSGPASSLTDAKALEGLGRRSDGRRTSMEDFLPLATIGTDNMHRG